MNTNTLLKITRACSTGKRHVVLENTQRETIKHTEHREKQLNILLNAHENVLSIQLPEHPFQT